MLAGRAGESVQSIDVLSNNRDDFTSLFQSNDCMMHQVWTRGAKQGPSFELVVPVLDSRCFRGHEVLVVNRPSTGPNTIWPSEIRDSASGRDSSPRKDHDPARFSDKFDQILKLRTHLRNSSSRTEAAQKPESPTNHGDGLFSDVRKILISFSTMSGDWRPYSGFR